MPNVRMKPSVLVVDDDPTVRLLLERHLEREGYVVLAAAEGKTALDILSSQAVDLAILDLKMPGINGFSLCRSIRESSNIPIIMLTALDSVEEKVRGFECGADDYVTKPFAPKELSSRLKAILKRCQGQTPSPAELPFSKGDLEIDFAARKVSLPSGPVDLTPTEFDLLKELVLNRGKILTHRDLLQTIWGSSYETEAQYLHVFISRLRKKLSSGSEAAAYIVTLPGVGYSFQA
jgi:two-component system, OmpR family, KDP operon response regulator KdpE